MTREKKKSLTVTLPPDVIEYLGKKVNSREFSSMSHGVEICVLKYMEAKAKEENKSNDVIE
ncbi:hypothetical protein [Candidatus Methanomassiliicoccus intestinalis]|jgi:Arc/MetJ-type ribon-helix-helix transcriptional regulator|uniref:CopG-like ribbon-helix-helix domain-containing protein n=2 Tax=Candidatus Methanomassiliicoccus intestinalis TaxID=1406512 RepID=R9T437_METII|nr:hypothetical protein [Candidatus Methanomassiliicoccus intestinalis]AGN25495.1 hypothetical protein MMINT_00830 [Candidatus Methanomassiliicoccus intestinalis Issoire-Mx1]TQS82557.1 MAG: hypothetical protein A3207_08885 [Candidatus Methanomassiliicoccus intestinalis]TQS83413.1 MAG: hypothetical protein A3206_08495 [Candidatus Methanomassiliicoccus intestinalis]